MAKKQLSIYIGANRTRICEVVRNSDKSLSLYNAIEVETPKGAVEDGYILDVPAMAEVIKSCIYGRGLTTNKVTFAIASKKIASKEVMIPFVKKERVGDIIRANANEYFPMSNIGDYVFAQSILETVQDDEGKKYRVNAIAAPRDIVMSYYDLSAELKIPIDTMDYAGNSMFQVLELQMDDTTTCMVLQIEKDNTFVSIMNGKTLVLQRAIPYGKTAVVNNLINMKRISEKDANLLLQDEGRLHAAISDEEFTEAVRFLIGGINRVMEYHMSRNSSLAVEEIKIFGEGCQLAGITNVLQNELNVKVSKLLNFQGVTVKDGGSLNRDDLLKYISCAGAVLNPVNLFVPGQAKKKSVSSAAASVSSGVSMGLLYGIMTAVAVGVIAAIGITAAIYIVNVGARDKLQLQVNSLQEAETIANTYYSAQADFNLIDNFYKSTESPNENLYRFMMDLEEVMPERISIVNFSIADGVITLSAIGTSKEQVADMVVQMKALPYIYNVFVGDMQQTYGVSPQVAFTMTMQMIPPSMVVEEPVTTDAGTDTEQITEEGGSAQ